MAPDFGISPKQSQQPATARSTIAKHNGNCVTLTSVKFLLFNEDSFQWDLEKAPSCLTVLRRPIPREGPPHLWATGRWRQGGFWCNQEANFKKSGSLIIPYLVAFVTAYYWKGSSYQGAAGNKSLEMCKEAADGMGRPLIRRAGDWVPDSGSLGKIPKLLGLNFPPWKIRGIH